MREARAHIVDAVPREGGGVAREDEGEERDDRPTHSHRVEVPRRAGGQELPTFFTYSNSSSVVATSL